MAATPGYVSNTELASRISALVDRWDQREYQMIDLLTAESGNVTVTDGLGKDHLIPSYRSLLTSVSGMVDDLSGAVAQVSDLTNSARRFSESATASSGRAAASAARAEELANGIAGSVAAGKADIDEHVAQANVGIAKSVSDAAASATAAASSEQAAASSAANAAGSSATAAVEANDASADAARAASSRNEALAYQHGADAAKAAALDAQAASEAARTEAGLIANAPVGTVLPGGGYSAMHWAKQAQATATGTLVYLGGWDASKGIFPPEPRTGHFYKVLVAGDVEGISFNPGDQMVYNGEGWDKIDNTDQVSTVNGKSGTVVLAAGDIVGLGALATRSDVDFTTHVKGKPASYPASPHGHAKAEVGLGNVDNTADADKPLSAAMRVALSVEEGARIAGDEALQRSVSALASDVAVVPFFTGKNRLINGDFRYWQRALASNVKSPLATYVADRWQTVCGGPAGASMHVGVQVFTTPVNGAYRYKQIAMSGIGPQNNCFICQLIEGVETLAGQRATLSFYAWADRAFKVGVRFIQRFQNGQDDVYTTGGVVSLSTTPATYSVSVDLPSMGGRTRGANSCLYVILDFAMTADGYGGQLVAQNGIVALSCVQLEAGGRPTAFEVRPESVEFALCQRYYQKTYNRDTAPGSVTNEGRGAFGLAGATNQGARVVVSFPVRMRQPPSIVTYGAPVGPAGTISQADGSNVPAAAEGVGEGSFNLAWSTTNGQWGGWWHYTADAELF